MRYLFPTLAYALLFLTDTASAAEDTTCTQERAKQVAAAAPAIAASCSAKVNGENRGCIFDARPPSPLNLSEASDPRLGWIVKASVIHSFGEKGQPRFMPEGFTFAFVSKTCALMGIMGNTPAPPSHP